jgi:hypothetical protein
MMFTEYPHESEPAQSRTSSGFHQLEVDDELELDLSPPPGLTVPLWRSLAFNVLDRMAPEKLPPLEITSEPVDVGMLVGDVVSLPWFRTVFTNLGDVISPETLPPLHLESRPVDVGELIADELGHGWWYSLMGNLRDGISLDRSLPLRLTSKSVDPGGLSGQLQLPRWSSVISGPKFYSPDTAKSSGSFQAARPVVVAVRPPKLDPELVLLERQVKVELRNSRIREAFWMAVFAAQVGVLVVAALK